MPQNAPIEPVLPMEDIQGIVVPGFFKPHHTLIGIVFPRGSAGRSRTKQFLRDLASDVADAAETLSDRRKHRYHRRGREQSPASLVLLALAFSFRGLRKLTPETDEFPGGAFRHGLLARSSLLGDPVSGPGSPSTWVVGSPANELDALIVVAGDLRDKVSREADNIVSAATRAGLQVTYTESGDVRPDLPGHEHFGFDDGISQPGIRGLASSDPGDFVTDRHIAADQIPETFLFGYPGQDLVWPGEFVLGQPQTGPDPKMPGPVTALAPRWTRNGSFLVFRRLVQDVGLFWRTMRNSAYQISSRPGFQDIDDVWLASRIVGRWPSGAPVNRVPDRDNAFLGEEPEANNHFRFDSNSRKFRLTSGYDDRFPMATADPIGTTCPWAAHIRKANTRDSGSDMGGRESTYNRRLLRVGIPFGPPLGNRYATQEEDPDFGKRGLLFLSIQGSIENQFEFLMARWMGDPARPKTPAGHDILVGQNDAPNEQRERRCVIFGARQQQVEIRTTQHWIIPTGGGYFFVPSFSAMRHIFV